MILPNSQTHYQWELRLMKMGTSKTRERSREGERSVFLRCSPISAEPYMGKNQPPRERGLAILGMAIFLKVTISIWALKNESEKTKFDCLAVSVHFGSHKDTQVRLNEMILQQAKVSLAVNNLLQGFSPSESECSLRSLYYIFQWKTQHSCWIILI